MITVKSNPINKINQFNFDITSRIEREFRYAYLDVFKWFFFIIDYFIYTFINRSKDISDWIRNSRKIPFSMKMPHWKSSFIPFSR